MSDTFSVFFNAIIELGLSAYAINIEPIDDGILDVYTIKIDETYIYWHCLNTEKALEYPAYDEDHIIHLLTIHILPIRYKEDIATPRDIYIAYQNTEYISELHLDVLTDNIIQSIVDSLPDLKYNPDYTVYDGQSVKMNEINQAYNEAFNTIIIDYPEQEVASFPLQTDQAKEYLSNPNAEVSFLRLLYAGRVSRGYTETLEELCRKILSKATLFEPISGYLSGIRQAMEKEIEAIITRVESGDITTYQGYRLCMQIYVEYPIPTREQFLQMITPV